MHASTSIIHLIQMTCQAIIFISFIYNKYIRIRAGEEGSQACDYLPCWGECCVRAIYVSPYATVHFITDTEL